MVASSTDDGTGTWMLLVYRMPREPSTARVAIWRKLKRLGVAQLADGVVALPSDARTREHLEWLADEVIEGGGAATVWEAKPGSRQAERELAETMSQARAAEYQAVTDQARTVLADGATARVAVARRLRGELRKISRRDYFPPPERTTARRAVQELDATSEAAGAEEVTP